MYDLHLEKIPGIVETTRSPFTLTCTPSKLMHSHPSIVFESEKIAARWYMCVVLTIWVSKESRQIVRFLPSPLHRAAATKVKTRADPAKGGPFSIFASKASPYSIWHRFSGEVTVIMPFLQ